MLRVMLSTKPRILHIIDSLGQGGAESLLINLLEDLKDDYEIYLVTLFPVNDFVTEGINCEGLFCLQYNGINSIPRCVVKFKKLIKQLRPDMVRAQLFTSSFIARIATPRNIPFVFSIHSILSLDSYKKNWFALPLEKITYKKWHHVICVSKTVQHDFSKHVGIKGPCYVLYNYVKPIFFERSRLALPPTHNRIRLVAVGNLRTVKNYFFLIDCFKKLKHLPITLDIYGDGLLKNKLQQSIDEHQLSIRLMGNRKDIYNVLPDYDLFVMCSLYEGFAIALAEAMAVGLPLLITNLPVLKEVTQNNALFFDANSTASFIEVIEGIMQNKYDLTKLSINEMELAKEYYSKETYLRKLKKVYSSVLQNWIPRTSNSFDTERIHKKTIN